ncbi:unnamed protein product (macronuclear) [Paramecium tetraurelia]|uniref:Protein kinase domain-containing protein n=1 Tax=Paramecium tetraurelia TaxID=5888 RepID=A0DDH0_PARTE|nr:uncharacterized protein GSPATT00015946001 [Paramecium tetraurelia]CAK81087.1 unnamed protein product [Paramecium tetraurelia]|eukprot:XP_001448484.1 hypothetical protein (macronuclear) [Paramecium tetraurelia strain d4-2]
MGNQCKGVGEERTVKSNNGLAQNIPSKKPRLQDFKKLKKLGQGAYGSVFLVEHKNEFYAMKEIAKSRIQKKSTKQHIDSERQILQCTKSKYLVELKYAFQDDRNLYMVVNYVKGGELFFHIREAGSFTLEICKFYSAQILMALLELHNQNIIYRDLKPENILLDEQGHVVLTDFGLSKHLCDDELTKSMCGTPEYLAPEIITSNNGYSFEVDYYSLGCIIYEMLNGKTPFYSTNKRQMFQDRLTRKVTWPDSIDETAISLVNGLLEIDPLKRLQGDEIKKHKFFEDINFDELRNVKPPYNFNQSSASKFFEQFNSTNKTTCYTTVQPMIQEQQFQFQEFSFPQE